MSQKKKLRGRELIATLSLTDRIQAAKAKTSSVVDHLLYLLELHENNALVVYSTLLSSQIPTSHAANAFNVFQRGMHQFELVRLCALWDSIELEKENVPTIVALIDRQDVIDALVHETEAHHRNIGTAIINPSDDPEIQKSVSEAFKRSEEEFGVQQGQKARDALSNAIDKTKEIVNSPRLEGIMNLRNKHLAHSLSLTRLEQRRLEQKAGPIAPMKYGDERKILDETLPIVETLYCWVNGCGFSFDDSRQIDRKNAKALWEGCTFTIGY